jgi:hypothetical protein
MQAMLWKLCTASHRVSDESVTSSFLRTVMCLHEGNKGSVVLKMRCAAGAESTEQGASGASVCSTSTVHAALQVNLLQENLFSMVV